MIQRTHDWLKASGIKMASSETLNCLLTEELEEFNEADKTGNRKEMLNAIADMLVVIGNFSYFRGFTPEEIEEEFDKVTKSNWTKFCNSEEEANQTAIAYMNGTHPNKLGKKVVVRIEHNNDVWVVKNLLNKIMKSINFKDVNEF